jgi:hypothetical protein
MASSKPSSDLSAELKAEVQQIADTKGVNIITFVAPQDAIRVSPVELAQAQINEKEMLKLEQVVKEAKEKNSTNQKLHLILHTPGGELFTSYKIAYFLRQKFTDISVFVPYEAASGGTLLCCAANTVYLGDLGNLTPIDPQLKYSGARVSAYAFERAVESIKEEFEHLSPDEVPTPYQQIISKFDPVVLDEMKVIVRTTMSYADKLLEKSGYPEDKAWLLAWKLTKTYRSHPHVITKDDAKEIGFNIKEDENTMKVYNKVVTECLKAKIASHVILPFYPSPQQILPSSITNN